jgi:uncharacterized protein YlaN (UPF0358 family)
MVYACCGDTYESTRPLPRHVQCETNDKIVHLIYLNLETSTLPSYPLHSSRPISVSRPVIAEQSSRLLLSQLTHQLNSLHLSKRDVLNGISFPWNPSG